MPHFPPHSLRTETLAARRLMSPLFRHLPGAASAVALFAVIGSAHAQQPNTQPPQQEAPPASVNGQPQAGQVIMQPVDVTAAKPRKAAKKRQTAPGAANTAPGQAADSGGAAVPVQAKTQLGRLTAATPLNGSVVEKEQIDAVKPADVQRELMVQIPGVSMVRNMRIPIGGKGYTNNVIDGLSTKSSSLGTVGFVDEVNTWDIQAIEVTRGPASVLYNSKAIGGTINIITRDPPKTPEAGVWGDAGSYGFRRMGVHAAGASEDGAFGYFLDVNSLQDDAWRDRSAREKQSASGKFVLRPDADTKITFRSEYVDSYREFPGSISEAQFKSNWRQAFADNLYEDMKFATTAIDVKRNIGRDGELTLAYSIHQNWGVNACTAGCSGAATSITRETEMDYSQDNLRAVYRQDFALMKSRVYAGMDAFLSTEIDDTYGRTGFVRNNNDLKSAYTVNETNLAPFAQYEFSPLDRLRFTFGVRQEMYDFDIDDRSPGTNRDGTKSYSSLVKKGGATYEYASNHFLWGSVAEGFYVPSTSQTVSGANAKDLPPETSLTYGIGIRGKLPVQRFSYDIGLYHSIIHDQAVSMPCPAGGPSTECPDDWSTRATYPVAAGEVQFRGIETALSWRPFDFLRLDVAHTYALNTYVEFDDGKTDYSGNDLAASPKHHVNARATVYPLPGLSTTLEADYISSYYTDATNRDTYQRPVIFNMRAAYDTGYGLELWGHAYNLFDVKYAERVSSSYDSRTRTQVRTYSEGYHPLTVRAGLSYRW